MQLVPVRRIGGAEAGHHASGDPVGQIVAPVDTSKYGKENVRELAAHCRELMEAKIAELDAEVAQRNAAKK